jgi:hypothetical protein
MLSKHSTHEPPAPPPPSPFVCILIFFSLKFFLYNYNLQNILVNRPIYCKKQIKVIYFSNQTLRSLIATSSFKMTTFSLNLAAEG